jgi:DNA repair protein RecO (recombination protein O)
MISTPGIVLHTTPYGDSSVIVKVFTRTLGVRSYIIKGVRGRHAKVKQNLLQPLSCLDMVVYDNPKTELNYVKELSPRDAGYEATPVESALRFFMTEVLYKSLQEAEPMPALYDYVESVQPCHDAALPIVFLLTVSRHLGIEPLDNYCPREALFDLQEGRYVSSATETTLSPKQSEMLHEYLASQESCHGAPLQSRRALIDSLLAYYQLHLSGFHNFTSHEILHTILK